MDESLDDRLDMPAGCPKATTMQSPTSESGSHIIPPVPTDARVDNALAPASTCAHMDEASAPATTCAHADEAQAPATTDACTNEARAPATTGVHEEGVPVPATVEGSHLSTSVPPINVSLTEDPQLANGHALKKRKVAAPAIVSNSISDKYDFIDHMTPF